METHGDMEGKRERRWTPKWAKAQYTKASLNSLETHLVRKWRDIGHLRALSPWSNGWMDESIHPYIQCTMLSDYAFLTRWWLTNHHTVN